MSANLEALPAAHKGRCPPIRHSRRILEAAYNTVVGRLVPLRKGSGAVSRFLQRHGAANASLVMTLRPEGHRSYLSWRLIVNCPAGRAMSIVDGSGLSCRRASATSADRHVANPHAKSGAGSDAD